MTIANHTRTALGVILWIIAAFVWLSITIVLWVFQMAKEFVIEGAVVWRPLKGRPTGIHYNLQLSQTEYWVFIGVAVCLVFVIGYDVAMRVFFIKSN